MKKEFQMSDDELRQLAEIASQPVMFMSGGVLLFDHQQQANRVWKQMGDKYGFIWDTGESIPGKPARFFKAIPKQINNE